jgi:hypothetical protein
MPACSRHGVTAQRDSPKKTKSTPWGVLQEAGLDVPLVLALHQSRGPMCGSALQWREPRRLRLSVQ